MGRELRRVPLDFNWPLNKVWEGYINPYRNRARKCPDCELGYAPEAHHFYEQWYGNAPFDSAAYGTPNPVSIDHPAIKQLAERNVANDPEYYRLKRVTTDYPSFGDLGPNLRHESCVMLEAIRLFEQCFADRWCHNLIQEDVDALIAAGRLMDFTRRPRNPEQEEQLAKQKAEGGSGYWLKEPNGYHPTAEEVNDWSLTGMGHDGINLSVCLRARCEREGVIYTCPTCDGHAEIWDNPKDQHMCENWSDFEPPEGEGYQLWETTSEGSPVSPVFATLDALCEYAASHCSTFGSHTASKEQWRKMLDDDFVCHKEGNMLFI